MPSIIHLVFKTHLDIGFTDYAASVVQTYFRHFIPQAVTLARRTRESDARFRWTTGAWLIYAYLEQAAPDERRAMEAAIAAGDILWHALPFTTHTELMDESLFRFGLSYSQKLDVRFGRTTVAAKMTDVPGHTRASVPLLASAGVRFLHIGVNPASSIPEVPPVFLWRDEATQTELVMVYDQTYGGVTQVEGMDDVLAVVLTGDNVGPPSEAAVAATYDALRRDYPDARVIGSSLDAYAVALDAARDRLSVVTAEIGDTWIQGVGTDPTKVRHYRELSRLRRAWLERDLSTADRARVDAMSRHLVMIPEHTWGMDEKTHLADYERYDAAGLADLRQSDAGRRFEASWAEQRGYVDAALGALDGSPLADEAKTRLAAIEPRMIDLSGCEPTDDYRLRNERFDVNFDAATGAIISLFDRRDAAEWASSTAPLALPTYEVFGKNDYDRYWSQYIRPTLSEHDRRWALPDNVKVGIPREEHSEWQPTVHAAYRDGASRLIFALELPPESRVFGAPERLFLDYRLNEDGIDVVFLWFGKPACRLAEALWLSFAPLVTESGGWRLEKMGEMIDPRDVVSKGARTLHAVEQRIAYTNGARRMEIVTLDAPLVAPGRRALLDFHNTLPDARGGVHVNLYNNVWGTNFPMWFDEDAAFRFSLRLGG